MSNHRGAWAFGLAAALGSGVCTAQSYQIDTKASASYALPQPIEQSCKTHSATSCTSEAASTPPIGGDTYAWAGYQDIIFGGDFRAIASAWAASGCPGGSPCTVSAESFAACGITFYSLSATLPPGTPIRIRSIIPTHGAIGRAGLTGYAVECFAQFGLVDDTHPIPGLILYKGAAKITPPSSSVVFSGNWADSNATAKGVDVVIPNNGATIPGVELTALHFVQYDTILGQDFNIGYSLSTKVTLPGASGHYVVADFANTSSFTLEAVDPVTGAPLDVEFVRIKCFADCDQSTGLLNLDLFDFLCFLNKFNASDPFADCDENGALDIFDFLCFTNAFNSGCG